MPTSAFTHIIIPKWLTYSMNWCSCRQTRLKVIKPTTMNELLWHRHFSSPLWLMYMCNAPALVKSNLPPFPPSCDTLIWISVIITSHTTSKTVGTFLSKYQVQLKNYTCKIKSSNDTCEPSPFFPLYYAVVCLFERDVT